MTRRILPACLGPLVELPEPIKITGQFSKTTTQSQGSVAGFAVPASERTQWCWCAVSLGLLKHYNNTQIEQCMLAEDVFGGSICDDTTNNSPANMDEVLTKLDLLAEARRNGPLSEQVIRGEIHAQRPVVVQLYWSDRRHVVAISAYVAGANQNFYLYLNDPARNDGSAIAVALRPFSYFGATWQYSFLTKAPR
ncbi:papain-like cysteine protease family protein [Blastomonas aquatica]|uniref:papain-like cysteine protease family protein n=1 Tax=Blastomonas aquatica TaxID=1510276 RepID=UPI00166B2D8A|nr:papain-like cysteine protease family protein [Blastomonas aquatica]